MVARDCFVKQETPSIQIPKFYLNSLHKDTSFKKNLPICQCGNNSDISLSSSGNDKPRREMPVLVKNPYCLLITFLSGREQVRH